ncbi:hypothetical protein TWF481_011865 [Arthrobotrys musiformis]|uniref:Uncharacterized protein n=1 Tax=Arthrobotrys musiformis TaxID=47236 RepID=A0AAV9VVI0_9PEZI
MRFVYALAGISPSIWAHPLLSSVVITSVSGETLKLPVDPSWNRYLLREARHLNDLGYEIDFTKGYIQSSCAVYSSWESLSAMIETLLLAITRLRDVTLNLRQPTTTVA